MPNRLFEKHNKKMLIASSHANDEIEKQVIEFLVSCRCDALILHAEALSVDCLWQPVWQNIELVLLNRFLKEMKQ